MGEEGILSHLKITVPFGIFMFLTFCLIRHRYRHYYYRNIILRGRALLPITSSLFAWISDSLWGVKDEMLLEVAGLDAVTIINTFKLILLICVIISLPCLLILVPYYYFNSDHSEVHFVTFTIAGVYEESFWIPFLVQVFITLVALYVILCFYRHYIQLRQIYLLKPSCLTSIKSLLDDANQFGSMGYSRSRQDSRVNVVLLRAVPKSLGDAEALQEKLQKSGLKGLKRVQFIGNLEELEEKMKARNEALSGIEAALQTLCGSIEKANKASADDNKTDDNKASKASADDNKTDDDKTENLYSIKERVNLLHQLISDESLYSEIRPRHKIKVEAEAAEKEVDSLQAHYAKLMEKEAELQTALDKFATYSGVDEREEPAAEESKSEINRAQLALNEDERFVDETTFISFTKLAHIEENLNVDARDFEVMKCTRAALLHFDDFRDASRASQVLLTALPHALHAQTAPAPQDLNWKTVKWSRSRSLRGKLSFIVVYILFLLAFAPITAIVVSLINMKAVGKIIPAVGEFQAKHEEMRAIIQGIAAPFIMHHVIEKAGRLIVKIVALKGPTSQIQSTVETLRAKIFFTFFQTIVLGALFGNIHDLLGSFMVSSGTDSFLGFLRTNIPTHSHLFFNILILHIFHVLVVHLLRPVNFIRYLLKSRKKSSLPIRKQINLDTMAEPVRPVFTFGEMIIFPFMVAMSFAVIAPLIMIPATIYFFCGLVVYRFSFLYAFRAALESGGEYWRESARHLIWAVLLGQLFLLIEFGQFHRSTLPAFLLGLLMLFTMGTMSWMEASFGRACENLSTFEADLRGNKQAVRAFLDGQWLGDGAAAASGGTATESPEGPSFLDALETAPILKSRLREDFLRASSFQDIDPLEQPADLSIPKTAIFKECALIFDPYWYAVPLNLIEPSALEAEPFSPNHVDHLIDTSRAGRQYEHPLIMQHSQVLFVPRKLMAFLAKN